MVQEKDAEVNRKRGLRVILREKIDNQRLYDPCLRILL